MLDSLETQEGEVPNERLAGFKTLLARCQESSCMDSEPLVLSTSQLKDINKLHEEFRNSFLHFTPQRLEHRERWVASDRGSWPAPGVVDTGLSESGLPFEVHRA